MSILRKKKKNKENLDLIVDLNDKKQKGNRSSTTSNRNTEFALVTYFFVILFLAMIIYFAYFMYAKSETVINSSYNKRTDSFSEKIVRGSILASDGSILAETKTDSNGNESRSYPYGKTTAHVVGYTIQGMSGIESFANFYMLRSHAPLFERIAGELTGNKNAGDNIVTTLNIDAQQAAYDALGSYDGAVVVIQPSTGKIIAMVSKPTFDPNTLSADWESITSDSDSSVLLNRATQGLYPPGSIFKVFTTTEYMREHSKVKGYSFDCTGSFTYGSETIHCYGNTAHGSLDLKKSFAKSCNSSFANIGLTLNLSSFKSLMEDALFNCELPTSFEYKQSTFSLDKNASDGEIMQTAIGQGNTLVTPFHMALIAAAIDNGGELMTPYVIDHIENTNGVEVKNFSPSSYCTIFSKHESDVLKTYMEYTVTKGTASALSGQSYTAGGKTGSAEYSNSTKNTHSWFIGYASKEGYEDIAIAVIAEEGGSGSSVAVPIAKKVFDAYFSH